MSRALGVFVAVAALLILASASAPARGGHATVNGRVAFLHTADIYVVNPDGSNKTNLTNTDDALEQQAVFSPDGTSLAFVRTPFQGSISSGKDDVWVMNADGSDPRQITQAGDEIQALHWTADGSRLLYFAERDANSNNAEIYSINPDGTGQTTVTANGPHMDGAMSLSTAGNRIVFAAIVAPSTDSEIYIVNLDGTGFSRLTNDPGRDSHPVIAPNSTRIAWTTDRHNPADEFSTDSEIYAINADGTGQLRLTTSTVSNSAVEFSADSTQLGFNQASEAALMGADGSNPHVVYPKGKHFNFFEQFSPDGARIAMSDVLPLPGEDPHFKIQSVSADGTERINLTNESDDAGYFDWQATATAPTNEPMVLTATPKAKKQKAKKARVTVECSNECELSLIATVKAGGEKLRSQSYVSLYGDEPANVRMMKKRVAKKIEGERGKVKLKIEVIFGVGGKPKTTVTSKLKP